MSKINQKEYELLKGLNDEWEWIARDENGRLYKFLKEPRKVNDFNWKDPEATWLRMDDNNFQFIKWEDSEPYNIQELIEEYEVEQYIKKSVELGEQAMRYHARKQIRKESEETEVKKDKKWLEGEVDKIVGEYQSENIFSNFTRYMIYDIKDVIDQLDEPEVLSQEWIDEYAQGDYEEWVYTEDLQNLLVPKQEEITEEQAWEVIHGKYGDEVLQNNIDYVESQGYVVIERPTIPQFVADFIKDNKGRLNVYGGLVDVQSTQEGKVWEWVFYNHNQDEFAEAWLAYPNIEVEKEQKYYVELLYGVLALHQFDDYYDVFDKEQIEGNEEWVYQFTEQEIKDYDERYWPFAVKVEELEK